MRQRNKKQVLAETATDSASDLDDEPLESPTAAKHDENQKQKIMTRVFWSFVMLFALIGILYLGPLYICLLVMLIQVELFRELVNVRYGRAKEVEMPLFRTLQWTWFFVAMFFIYGDSLHQFCLERKHFLWLAQITQYHTYSTFAMYSALFVTTVLTLRSGLVKFQLNQMMWTIVTICLIVGQCKFIIHSIFEGIFWFFFPVSVVAMNDVAAYFCGMSMGKKFIKAPFFALSPKKTWEGFLGSFVCTMIFAFFWSRLLAQFEGLICAVDDISFIPQPIVCDVIPTVFQPRDYLVPWVNISVNLMPIQLHALMYGMFASLVAPFGGFLASAIKRAYGIKDFDSFIPGHGGVMDRMDCQLIMLLFTSVHFNTFVKAQMTTVPRLLASASLLAVTDQRELYRLLGEQIATLQAADAQGIPHMDALQQSNLLR